MSHILIASSNKGARSAIREYFGADHTVEVVLDREKCLEMFRRRRYEFLFIDVALLGGTLSVKENSVTLQPFQQAYPTAQIIVMSSQEEIREAVMTVKAGAHNYLTYPINPEEVEYVTKSLYESQRMESELHYLRKMVWKSDSFEITQTKSPVMQKVFEQIRSVAETRSTVLLFGETGTGKDVLARLIHRNSHRSDKQFIPVHCGAIPDTLLESDLFGHEKGAFTGAHKRKLGKFEIAHEGTIFLDEIGTITPSRTNSVVEGIAGQDLPSSRRGAIHRSRCTRHSGNEYGHKGDGRGRRLSQRPLFSVSASFRSRSPLFGIGSRIFLCSRRPSWND